MRRTLDYSAFMEPLNQSDVDALKHYQATNKSGLQIHRTLKIIFIVMMAMTAVFLTVVNFATTTSPMGRMVVPGIIGAVIIGIVLLMRHNTRRRAKLLKFAARNQMQYIYDAGDPGYAGMVFDEGHSRSLNDAFRLPDGVEIGNYTYVTGSGKHSQTHTWGYAKVKLPRRLPHMVLDAKGNNMWRFSNLSDAIDRSQVLKLEGDFNTYFTLYAPQAYERDALYVFTPDVMAAMIDHGKQYDIVHRRLLYRSCLLLPVYYFFETYGLPVIQKRRSSCTALEMPMRFVTVIASSGSDDFWYNWIGGSARS